MWRSRLLDQHTAHLIVPVELLDQLQQLLGRGGVRQAVVERLDAACFAFFCFDRM